MCFSMCRLQQSSACWRVCGFKHLCAVYADCMLLEPTSLLPYQLTKVCDCLWW